MTFKYKPDHPAYGMIQFSRVHNSSTRRLFGSSIERHYTTVRMTVSRARWTHDLNEDRYFSGDELIEVELSAAQFAELITTMNMGPGVPCTLRYVGGERIPDPPDEKTEVDRVRSSFKESLHDFVRRMQQERKRIEKHTEKLSAKAREEIRIALEVMIQQLASNVPFIESQFEEAAERVTLAAKKEIEAFTQHAVHVAGVTALRGEAPSQPQLPDPTPATREAE